MVKVKRFVSTILLFALVMMVPLEVLSQLEPEVTYGDWCRHLAELYAEQEAAEQEAARAARAVVFWTAAGTSALVAAIAFVHVPYIAVGSLVVGCAMYVLSWAYAIRVPNALYGERSYTDVLREIELWEQAGTARMWFYPCE